MSAILGVFNFDEQPEPESVVRAMLSSMARRGSERVEVWRDGGAVLAVTRHEWESDPELAGRELVIAEDDHVVVADASIYYRNDLRNRLAADGIHPPGDAPGHLILAAYQAWGSRVAEELEGDFAFIIWDRRRRRVVCGRDHSGVRPLHYADFGETLVVASTIGAVLQHPRCPSELDLASIALDAAGIWFAATDATSYRSIRVLLAGATGVRERGRPMAVDWWWDLEVPTAERPMSSDDAAAELRSLLGDAVEERVHQDRSTAICLSGGWDSASIYGVGQDRLVASGRPLHAVSMSYPDGNSGREDELIQAIVDRWGGAVHWVDIASVPLIGMSTQTVADRDEPLPFFYEHWYRRLGQETPKTGSRISLNGIGGNFLYEGSPVFLSDLLRTGKFRTLLREWRCMGGRLSKLRHLRHLTYWAILPLLPDGLREALAILRGQRFYRTYERPLPSWLRKDFVRGYGLDRRARDATPQAHVVNGNRSGSEVRWFMRQPSFARSHCLSFQVGLEEGIEARAPIYDKRVVRFSASGPWSERNSMQEKKLLLRHMMRGLLPDSVLTPRPRKTGNLRSYMGESLRELMPYLQGMLDNPITAEMGILDTASLKQTLDLLQSGRGHSFVPEQLITLAHVETWLRSRSRDGVDPPALGSRPTGVLQAV